MKCRKCNSSNVWFAKHLSDGKVQGKSYHYQLHCRDCKAHYHVARTKEVYEIVKDQEWVLPKHYKKKTIIVSKNAEKLF